MSDKSNHQAEGAAKNLCTDPTLGALVPGYLVDVLNDEKEEAVENHLIACDDCHGRYMMIIQLRHQGRQGRLRANRKKRASLERGKFSDAKPGS